MHAPSTLTAVPRRLRDRPQAAPYGGTHTRRMALEVEAVGDLAPRTKFTGHVHSVFVRVCKPACNATLLTLCAARGANGPLTLRLAGLGPQDLRPLPEAGQRIAGDPARIRTRRAELRWAQAAQWKPGRLPALTSGVRIEARLHLAAARRAHCRRTHPTIIDGAGAPVTGALREACRALDLGQAAVQIERLTGWGEG